jgi:hypothetical protein
MRENSTETERLVLTSFEEVRDGVVKVAACAKRAITILTPDLEPGIYDTPEFLDAVKHLALAKRYARVRVLISEPERSVRNGNRLIALGRRLSTAIDFRNLDEEYRGKLTGAFIIADDTAVLYRLNGRAYEGIMGSIEPAIARQHLDQFEKPWEVSAYQMPVAQL